MAMLIIVVGLLAGMIIVSRISVLEERHVTYEGGAYVLQITSRHGAVYARAFGADSTDGDTSVLLADVDKRVKRVETDIAFDPAAGVAHYIYGGSRWSIELPRR
jgi:hypothetical protein